MMGLVLFLIMAGILVLLVVLIWFTSVRIEILYKRENKNDRGEIKISALGGLVRFRVNLPEVKWTGMDEGMQVEGTVKGQTTAAKMAKEKGKVKLNRRTFQRLRFYYHEFVERFDQFHKTIRWFLSKVTFEKLTWVTKIGTGDAAESGILTGVAWGIKTTLIGFFSQYTRWREAPQLTIHPEFNREVLETYFHSIIRFRVGHAILGAKRLLLHMRTGRERTTWQNIQFKA
ncbi:DUF2953 domain-containing protein [Thermoactinomyces sp. CICC 10521]|nr:DUF2953 domain-containing protein [Thermoactinomyces sp. CICC 10523]MBH8603432.1 DUF2953 domain-containing protein [Thermoactinomyces sp. CICC 10522]MBH8609272.1 DUF2953 domain-containing protein [Thermoactinomyces sp. CICC 10521]